MIHKKQMPKLKCLRCSYEWNPRVEDVRICPNCRSAYWDVEKKRKPKLDEKDNENEFQNRTEI